MDATLISGDNAGQKPWRFLAGLLGLHEAPGTRQVVFAALVTTGFLNGVSGKIHEAIGERGLSGAFLETFGISIILWGACAIVLLMLLRAPARRSLDRRDLSIAALASICFLLPVPALAWVGLVVLGLHLVRDAPDGLTRRAGIIVLALTVPLFWARLLFAALMAPILRIDAHLVGWAIGTTAHDNVVPYAGGRGELFIAPACSSLANLSLAFLSAALFVNIRSGRWTRATLGWYLVSMAGVVAINVLRLALMAIYPDNYDLIHGPVGATIAGWSTMAVILIVGYHWIGHDAHNTD